MRIEIGKTRSGRRIEIETDVAVRIQRFLSDYSNLSDRYDAFTLILFLRRQEQRGWRLTPQGSEGLFEGLAEQIELDPATSHAVATARRSGLSDSAFADFDHGRQMALSGLRR
jgi:hypothetical protein